MERVLIIDDQHSYAIAVERALKQLGYQATAVVVKTVDEALVAIRLHSPEWLVLDINFGGATDSSGITVAEAMLKTGVVRHNIILHSEDKSRQYWASKLNVHHCAKLDVSSIDDCMRGECAHKTEQP